MVTILQGDSLEVLKTLPAESIQMCVTSPPYYGLRDYGVDGQIGLEADPEEYIAKLVAVFAEVRRTLKPDGVLWVNIGDSYAGSGKGGQSEQKRSDNWQPKYGNKGFLYGLKPKDLIGIPWLLAFALRADGWYLRSDIIWSKPNPMPESVTDRPTKSHEYIFLLSKSAKYYYDAEAIKEAAKYSIDERIARVNENHKSIPDNKKNVIRQRKPAGWDTRQGAHGAFHREGRAQNIEYTTTHVLNRNKRSVWTVATQPFKQAHFATFPPDLIKPCILAGSREGDTVLDPFAGSGTTGMVAEQYGRNSVLIELNPEYIEMIKIRTAQIGLFGKLEKVA